MPSPKTLLPLFAVLLLAGCGSRGAAPEATASAAATTLTVSVATPVVGAVTTTIRATGNVAAHKMVLVSAEASGLALQQVPVSEGETVKKGQVLAQLETDKLQAQIDQQVAANRGSAASLEAAQLAFDRGKALSSNGNLSSSDLQSRQSALDTAKSTAEQGEAALKSLRLQLAQATITAPVDGRLASASPTVGQVVQAGTTLFSIIENDDLEVQAKVPEQTLGKIQPGENVAITGNDGSHATGTVRAIAQQVDAATRLGTVYITLPSASGFRIGMSAQVSFETAVPNAMTVPETALAWREGDQGVFTIDSSATAHFTKVEAGAHQDGRVVIVAGLAADQQIAVDGVGFLNEGTQVRIAASSKTQVSK